MAWKETVVFYSETTSLAQAYDDGGAQGAYNFAKDQYSALSYSENENIRRVGELLLNAQNSRIDFFQQLSYRNCTASDDSDECQQVAEEIASQSNLGTKIESLVEEARVNAATRMDDVLPSVWAIEKILDEEAR